MIYLVISHCASNSGNTTEYLAIAGKSKEDSKVGKTEKWQKMEVNLT